ncbi:DUF2892 domain-containing protein [Sulfurimonas sp. SAG-AH-194-I05]|nr:DUF2892 domain-containing protein [Sulfurimonas sp. SAG-AH-194-I05]MDF1876025.1 DUF2892 domain-containing protein [Sulfurimonas sp. SAG-AH-194-I05]
MNVEAIRATCRVIRVVVGLAAVSFGAMLVVNDVPNYWYFLGLAPLIAGAINFCPLCLITKQCDLPKT